MSLEMHQYGLFEAVARWHVVKKGDLTVRELADRHYSRQTPGHPQWTRPGYNYVLRAFDKKGEASFCWWRPKWEAGIERKDRLRVLECTIFRNETSVLSSTLIRHAMEALLWPEAETELHHPYPERFQLITGIDSKATRKHRGRGRMAGWTPFDKGKTGRADVWLEARVLSPTTGRPM